MITVTFKARDFINPKVSPSGITFQVQRYKNAANGGPFSAEIRATGADMQLWEMLDFLRCPVFLTSEQGDYLWWGYVAEVEVIARNQYSNREGKVRIGASLDNMFNRVAVAYEDIAVGEYGGERYTTAYTSDTLSQREYGIKDGLFSGESATSATLAEQARDILLVQKKYPVPTIDLNYSGSSEAFIRCRGWWDTLNWRQCSIPVELALSYDATGAATEAAYNFGTVAIESIAQGIAPSGADINMAQVSVYIRKVGSPTDDVTIALYSNPDDLTPTVLAATSDSKAGGDLTTSYAWTTFTFSPEQTLTAGTKYFLVLARSGAMDDTNYYQVSTDGTAAGYGAATFVKYDGAAWAAVATDMSFRIYDNAIISTSTQILNICTLYGQFFSVVESTVSSGITSESYRDGDGSALYEAEQLMQHGTTNDRRILTTVDAARRCTIYEEPADISTNYYRLFSDSHMEDAYGAPIRKEVATCGVYARLVDVIPPSVNATILGSAAIRFIETAEYDVVEGRIIYQAREELNPLTVGRPLDG